MWFFLTMPWIGLQCEIEVFHDHTHVLVSSCIPGAWPDSYRYLNIYIISVDKTLVSELRPFGLLVSNEIRLQCRVFTFRVQTGVKHGGRHSNSFLLLIKVDPICNSLVATFKRVVRTHVL